MIDTETGRTLEHRAGERFPMCSTFKLLAAAAALKRVDDSADRLDRVVAYGPGDLLEYAPVTKAHVAAGGMTLADLCAAAIDWSDNTAGNLVLQAIGGPAGFTQFARSLGDSVTRLDRNEPGLNEATPGDERDTTTPRAMADDMRRVLLGDVLSEASRRRLEAWLIDDKVGDKRLRAGLPPGWRIGDKTGSGDHGTANTIAIIRPPERAPIIAAVYLTEFERADGRAQRHSQGDRRADRRDVLTPFDSTKTREQRDTPERAVGAQTPQRRWRRAIAWANQNQPSANGTMKLNVIASIRFRSVARLIVTPAPKAKAGNGGGSGSSDGPGASREGRSRTHSSVLELVPASRRLCSSAGTERSRR